MSADLTWGEVLSKFSSLVQQYDKGDTIVEARCRSLFAEAVPSEWLREHGLSRCSFLRIIPSMSLNLINRQRRYVFPQIPSASKKLMACGLQ